MVSKLGELQKVLGSEGTSTPTESKETEAMVKDAMLKAGRPPAEFLSDGKTPMPDTAPLLERVRLAAGWSAPHTQGAAERLPMAPRGAQRASATSGDCCAGVTRRSVVRLARAHAQLDGNELQRER